MLKTCHLTGGYPEVRRKCATLAKSLFPESTVGSEIFHRAAHGAKAPLRRTIAHECTEPVCREGEKCVEGP